MTEPWGWIALVGLAATSWLAVRWALAAGERRGRRLGYRAGHAAGRTLGYQQGRADALRTLRSRSAGEELQALTALVWRRSRAAARN